MDKESFFWYYILYILINGEEEFRKNIKQILMEKYECSAQIKYYSASRVDGKRSPLKLFLVNILAIS